jgi:hypothetical protein
MSVNLAPPHLFTVKELVFDDDFSGTGLNTTYWNTFMTRNSTQGGPWDSNGLGGSGMGGIYEADYDEPYEISVDNGLTLNAVQQSVVGENYVDGAVVQQTYSVTASVVDTYGKMEFDGGYLQISMKEPSGDGSWPSLWLLPGAGAGDVGNNFEIDIQEGGYRGGSANPNDVMAYHLHTSVGTFGGEINTGKNLTASFNTYAINWIPGQSITWFLDGVAVAEITSAQAPIPNEPMELIMSNQVATSAASSWRTSLDGATPRSMPMEIGDVQLYQAPGSGETITGSNVSAPPASPPSVAITSAGGSTTQAKQLISGTVDLADVGSTVLILDAAVEIGSASVASNGTWSATVTLTNQGANILTATDTNASGTGTSAPVDFLLSPPAAPIVIDNSGGGLSYSLGNQNYQITLGGFSNDIVAGNGDDTISPGAGDETVQLGDGDDKLTLTGFSNSITAGNGADAVTGGLGQETVKLGNGSDSVNLGGYYDNVSVGNGADSISGGAGNETIVAGSGADTISLAGYDNSVQLGAGKDVVNGGQGGDEITLSGGSATVDLAGFGEQVTLESGVSASITDLGSGLSVDVASSSGNDVITGFAEDTSGVINLLNGAGGFSSVSQVLGALRGDGQGGSLLSLGAGGSIDIVGVAPSHLNAGNFGL